MRFICGEKYRLQTFPSHSRLKALELEREERARDAGRLRELEKARDEAQRRADAMEAVATEVVINALSELATVC